VKARLEPEVDPHFHPDSYGYRPAKSALDAVGQARQIHDKKELRCDYILRSMP
jgi:retron-type reverse transcriptase